LTAEEIKALLRELNLSESFVTDQTAFTILALADREPRQDLLPGHSRLSDGARIHDILEYVRWDLGRPVAENTRESYRKTSLRPLLEAGWIIRHQLSPNDPKTYYRLSGELARLLELETGEERDRLSRRMRLRGGRRASRRSATAGDVVVHLQGESDFVLSPGPHNELEKAVVEILAPALAASPKVVYLGDTAPRKGFQDRTLMRRLNLPIDLTSALPDVIILGEGEDLLLVIEAVTSSGPITPGRLDQLRDLAKKAARLGFQTQFVTAFPTRRDLRRFVQEIAWGTSVWIAEEPWNLIHFEPLPRTGEP
jgi:hypothetical protein